MGRRPMPLSVSTRDESGAQPSGHSSIRFLFCGVCGKPLCGPCRHLANPTTFFAPGMLGGRDRVTPPPAPVAIPLFAGR